MRGILCFYFGMHEKCVCYHFQRWVIPFFGGGGAGKFQYQRVIFCTLFGSDDFFLACRLIWNIRCGYSALRVCQKYNTLLGFLPLVISNPWFPIDVIRLVCSILIPDWTNQIIRSALNILRIPTNFPHRNSALILANTFLIHLWPGFDVGYPAVLYASDWVLEIHVFFYFLFFRKDV